VEKPLNPAGVEAKLEELADSLLSRVEIMKAMPAQ